MISVLIDKYWYYLCLNLDSHHDGDDGCLGVDYDEHGHCSRR